MSANYLTVAQVAQEKGVTITAVYKAIEEKRIPSKRILGKLALKRSDVLVWQPKERTGRKSGTPMSEEAKARISASQKKRWAEVRASGKKR